MIFQVNLAWIVTPEGRASAQATRDFAQTIATRTGSPPNLALRPVEHAAPEVRVLDQFIIEIWRLKKISTQATIGLVIVDIINDTDT